MKKRLLIILVLLVALIATIFWLIRGGSYKQELEAYKKSLLTNGEKLLITEVEPPRRGRMSESAAKFTAVSNLLTMAATTPPIRTAAGYASLTPEQQEQYKGNVIIIAQYRAALDAGKLDFDLNYSLGAELPLPHLAKLKGAEVLATATVAQALAQKDYQEAWADLLASVDIVRLHDGEPVLISDLVRVANLRMAVQAAMIALQEHEWTDAQLANLQARWDAMNLFANAENALTMETAMTVDIMDQARKDPAKLLMFSAYQAGSTIYPGSQDGWLAYKSSALYRRFKTWNWRSTWAYDEELRSLQLTLAARDAARKIVKTGAFTAAFGELNLQYTNINQGHSNAAGHFLLYKLGGEAAFTKYLGKLAEAETHRRLAVTAIALARYKVAQRSYPQSLEDLVPKYFEKVPIDFMDGKPLRYRLQPDGDYLLYSVGLDGKDDGGTSDLLLLRPTKPSNAKTDQGK